MASSADPDAPAAMAVDREAERAGALLGSEEDIEDDVLSSLLSASWQTPAVVDEKYGRYSWVPLGGSIVELRFDAVESRRMTSICMTIRGMYDTLYAVPEGTVTDFLFLRSREDWRICQVLRHLAVREIPPKVGDKPHFSLEYYPGSPLRWGRWTAALMCQVRWGSGRFAPPSTFPRCMNSVRCATYLWYAARPCIRPHQCGGSTMKCPEVWPRGCPGWWHSR